GSAGDLDEGGAQVGAAERAGVRDEPLGEVAVDALVGALAVVRGVQPVRRGRSGQVIAGHHEGREPLERVDGAGARAGDLGVQGYVGQGLVRLVRGQRGLARLAGGRTRIAAERASADDQRAGAVRVVGPAEVAGGIRARRLGGAATARAAAVYR